MFPKMFCALSGNPDKGITARGPQCDGFGDGDRLVVMAGTNQDNITPAGAIHSLGEGRIRSVKTSRALAEAEGKKTGSIGPIDKQGFPVHDVSAGRPREIGDAVPLPRCQHVFGRALTCIVVGHNIVEGIANHKPLLRIR